MRYRYFYFELSMFQDININGLVKKSRGVVDLFSL